MNLINRDQKTNLFKVQYNNFQREQKKTSIKMKKKMMNLKNNNNDIVYK